MRYHDPRVPAFHLGDDHEGGATRGDLLKSVDLTEAEVLAADIVVVLVAHPELDLEMVLGTGTPVFDAVNATRARDLAHVDRL